MSLELQQKQKQTLHLTTYMKQSLAVLEMPIADLASFLESQAQENPMLEYEPFDFSIVNRLSSYYAKASTPESTEQFYNYEAKPETFTEYLKLQLSELSISSQQKILGKLLIEDLDKRGYLEDSIDALAPEWHCSFAELEEALKIVQSLHPKGVAARNLQECLCLQLEHYETLAAHIINNNLSLVGENAQQKLCQIYQLKPKEIKAVLERIRSLNPIPAQGFAAKSPTVYVIPEAIVDENLKVELIGINDANLKVNSYYTKLLESGCDATTETYLKEHLQKAQALIKSLQERGNTLTRILQTLITVQKDFFRQGKAGLKPFAHKDLAKLLAVHESTISRAIKDKYIVCTQGAIPLKDLFSNGLTNGVNLLSVAAIKVALCKLIAEEDKQHPLSDRELVFYLQKQNITISRRTVAKYRETCNIPPASKRKRKKE